LANEESSKEGGLIGKWEQIKYLNPPVMLKIWYNDECSYFVDGLFAGLSVSKNFSRFGFLKSKQKLGLVMLQSVEMVAQWHVYEALTTSFTLVMCDRMLPITSTGNCLYPSFMMSNFFYSS
jgi:hypothetical protein